jgi:hypothetical protein
VAATESRVRAVGGGDLTLGDVCDQIGQVVCDKFADCGGVPPNCERDFKAGCCGDSGDCGQKSQRDQSAVDDCADDIRGLSCSTTNVPSSCTGF